MLTSLIVLFLLAVILFAGFASSLVMAQQQATGAITTTTTTTPPSMTTGQTTPSQPEPGADTTPLGGSSGVGGITISDLDIVFLTASGPVASDTNTYNGPCPVGASISGTITDNVGNRDVTYRLIMDDGALPEGVRHFDQPGSERVSFGIQTIGGFNNVQSYQGWFAIEILQPVQLQSNRVEFQTICTPSTGGAPPAQQPAPAAGTDTTAPTLTVPNNIVATTATEGSSGYSVGYSVTAQDNVDGTATLDENNMLLQDNVNGSIAIDCFPRSHVGGLAAGNHAGVCIVEDAAGNQGRASFYISAGPTPAPGADTSPPTLIVPNDMVLQTNNGGTGARLVYSVTAQDNVDGTATLDENNMLLQDNVEGNIAISCDPYSSATVSAGNHAVLCYAVDAAGNSARASFRVSITSTTTTTTTSPGGPSNGGTITASLSVNPPIYEGPCPPPSGDTILQFSGTITDNVGNRDVTYRFVFSTGATTPEQTIHFDQPGSQSVSINTTPVLGEGWGAIEILQPVQLQSNRADFQITCTAQDTGGAPPAATLQAEEPEEEAPPVEEEAPAAPPANDEGGGG